MKKETGIKDLKERSLKKIKGFISSHLIISMIICLLITLCILSLIITTIVLGFNGGIKKICEYPDNRFNELEVAMSNFDVGDEEYKEYLRNLGVEYSVEYIESDTQEGKWEIILRKPDSLMFRPDPEVKVTCKNFVIDKESLQDAKRNYQSESFYKIAVLTEIKRFVWNHSCMIAVLIVIILWAIFISKVLRKKQKDS